MEQEQEIVRYSGLIKVILWFIVVNSVFYEIALNFEGSFRYASYLLLPIVIVGIILIIVLNFRHIVKEFLLVFLLLFIPMLVIYRNLIPLDLGQFGAVFLNIQAFPVWLSPMIVIVVLCHPNTLNYLLSSAKKWNFLGVILGIVFIVALYTTSYTIRRYANAPLFFSTGLCLIYLYYGLLHRHRMLVVGAIVWILIAFLSNRREDLMYSAIVLIGVFFFPGWERTKQSLLLRYSLVLSICVLLVFSSTLLDFLPSFISDKYEHGGRNFIEQLFLDSRSELKIDYWIDMQGDLLLGKGLSGRYLTPEFAPIYDTLHDGRYVIEVGFLQILLKGGVLSLVSYLIVVFIAVFQGIFRSENMLTRIFSFLILGQLVIMFWARMPAVDPNFLLLWLLVGFNLSREVRKLSNVDIITILE